MWDGLGGGEMLVSYYLPGNSLAPPPSHRESAATARVVVEHAISGFVIFHQTRGRWLSGGAPTFSRMGGGWPIYDAKSLIFYALNILLGVKAVVSKLDVAWIMALLAVFKN